MTSAKQDYAKVLEISRKARVLGGISSLLGWDQETYMPPKASTIRGEQLKTLAGIIHEEQTGKSFKNALAKLIDLKTGKVKAKGLSQPQHASLREWRRDFLRETALPVKFVEEFAQLVSQSLEVWRHARKENSFQQFAPFLEKIVTMSRRKADLLGYQDHPYDALLDLFEPDITTKDVSQLFGSLRKSITPLLKKITSSKQNDDSILHGKFPEDKQIEFSKIILKDMGFDMEGGRLDLSTHPFSSSCHPSDTRITTRIHPTSVLSNVMTTMHECGHSLYDTAIPAEHYGSPLGEPISHGIHESQSRWWETRIGLSKPFWQYYLPILKKTFKGKLDNVSLDAFYRAINFVKPSFIRVEADEVTYPLHVVLRFEIEKGLIEGSIKVREIPEAWNSKMVELLGIKPKNNAEGCLQDVHWSMGAFGYFPSYALGNLYASHLFTAFEEEFPEWKKRVAKGDLTFIRHWLSEAVHQHGRRYSSKELLKKVTGKAFSADAYVSYLNNKYAEIYH